MANAKCQVLNNKMIVFRVLIPSDSFNEMKLCGLMRQ